MNANIDGFSFVVEAEATLEKRQHGFLFEIVRSADDASAVCLFRRHGVAPLESYSSIPMIGGAMRIKTGVGIYDGEKTHDPGAVVDLERPQALRLVLSEQGKPEEMEMADALYELNPTADELKRYATAAMASMTRAAFEAEE